MGLGITVRNDREEEKGCLGVSLIDLPKRSA
jgi:hypothetical protein